MLKSPWNEQNNIEVNEYGERCGEFTTYTQ